MNMQPIKEYFEALERLIIGRPSRVPKGTKITNDAVALEAGRGKGSIKKSRSVFLTLIQAISDASAEQSKEACQHKIKVTKEKTMADQSRRDLDAALARELSLLYQVYELKKELARLTGMNVLPIRRDTSAK